MAANSKKQNNAEFAKGVSVKVVNTKFGEIVKVGINLEEFCNNPVNDSGFINFEIKTAKSGSKYATLQQEANK